MQRRDEQTAVATSMDSSQQRDRVVNKRADPDQRGAAGPPLARNRVDHPGEFCVFRLIRMNKSQNNGKTASTTG